MAIWQCSFLLAPDTEGGCDRGALEERSEEASLWGSAQPDEEIRRTAEKVLGKSPTWSADVEIWGDESSTCLKMIQELGRIVEVIFRIDLRNIQKADLVQLLDSFRRAHVVLIDENERRCEPTLSAVRGAMMASTAWRYLQDPRAFLASLSESKDGD
ncbi:hypothetical protein AB3662_16665 [Sorangium cellulosum]|uniref:hypothetical protein n=1 Tax=Sorangium cellulosum TaxID=56 RepID=UPI003D9A8C20